MEFPVSGKNNNPLPWILALITGGVLFVGVATYMTIESPAAKDQVEELTVPVTRQNLTVLINASGVVEPIDRIKISPKVSGRLIQLMVNQGDQVKRGQTLAIMDNREIQAQGAQVQAQRNQAIAALKEAEVRINGDIQQARARVIQAEARLKEAQASIPKNIDQVKAQVEKAKAEVVAAQARLELAQQRVQRYDKLLKDGAVAQDRFDESLNEVRNAQAAFIAAQAGLFEAQQKLLQSENTARPEVDQRQGELLEDQSRLRQLEQNAQNEMMKLKLSVDALTAELGRVEIQFRDTILQAPFDGLVTQRDATPGDIVSPSLGAGSSSIIELARGLEVIAKVPEVDIAQIKLGQPVKIVADAFPGQTFQGMVRLVAPEAIVENNVTSFEVRIALAPGQEQLKSKMNVDVTFLGQQIAGALVVPTVAIVTREGKTGVMVPNINNQPEFKPVTIGLTLNDQTQILQGLLPGDRVYLDLPKDYREDEK
jgi:HlyD family secretion protein